MSRSASLLHGLSLRLLSLQRSCLGQLPIGPKALNKAIALVEVDLAGSVDNPEMQMSCTHETDFP